MMNPVYASMESVLLMRSRLPRSARPPIMPKNCLFFCDCETTPYWWKHQEDAITT